jgi:hypothetical protein
VEPSQPGTNQLSVSTSGVGIYLVECTHVSVRENTLIDTGWASILLEFANTDISVTGNRILGTNPLARDEGGSIDAPSHNQSAQFLETSNRNQRLVISGNYCTGNTYYSGVGGIRVGSTDGVIIEGNIIDQICREIAISVSSRGDGNNPENYLNGCNDVIIRGNLIYAAPATTVAANPSADPVNYIALYVANEQDAQNTYPSVTGFVVADNIVRATTSDSVIYGFEYGIDLNATSGGMNQVQVHSNILECLGTEAAILLGTAAGGPTFLDLRITGNQLTYPAAGTPSGTERGIWLGGLAYGATVRDNTIRGFPTGIETNANAGTNPVPITTPPTPPTPPVLRWLDDNFIVTPKGGQPLNLAAPTTTGQLTAISKVPGTIAAGATLLLNLVATDCLVGQPVVVIPGSEAAGILEKLMWNGWVSQNGQVSIQFFNVTTSSVTLSGSWGAVLPVIGTLNVTTNYTTLS